MSNDQVSVQAVVQVAGDNGQGQVEEEFEIEGLEEELVEGLYFLEPPLLLVDTDHERAIARQKEMMEFRFGGIGEENKEEKRMGLAMQQLDIEQRHALRLLLLYHDPVELAAHLSKCLADPEYGYGERADKGRTIAQTMSIFADANLEEIASMWMEAHRKFQQNVLNGVPVSFRSLFDFADLDSFEPILQRVGDDTWRLGVEGQGKHRDFKGTIDKVWTPICDTYVEWCDEDNATWLNNLKKRAAKHLDNVQRAAQADRLRKEKDRIEVNGTKIILVTERDLQDWPRSVTLGDQIGLSRLSGHSFYELAWGGASHVRRFEISGTTRNKVPFEHIDLALTLAEVLGQEVGVSSDPATPEEVEATYLRRMKASVAEVGPAKLAEVPKGIQGTPIGAYTVQDVGVTILHGETDFAYITKKDGDQALVLRRDPKKSVLVALPVVRGRVQRNMTLMTTPLAAIDFNKPAWIRALCAWGAWLTVAL